MRATLSGNEFRALLNDDSVAGNGTRQAVEKEGITVVNTQRPFLREKVQCAIIEPLESRSLFSALPAVVAGPPAESDARAVVKHSVPKSQSTAMSLSDVRTFSYVLANLGGSPEITQMAQSNYDMLIVDPNVTYKGNANFNMAAMVAQLHADHPGRVVLAYLDIGEAGIGRTYWKSNWKAPTADHHGNPSFLIEPDPYGWDGSYPVAYWSRAWQKLFLGPDGIVKRVMEAGFDGVSYAYEQSSELGFVPLVTQVSLADSTTTPPPSLT